MNKKLMRIIFIINSTVLLAFLCLSYSTMYKQNHAIPILEYHDITKNPADPQKPFTIPDTVFASQMEYLSQNCQVMPLRDLLSDIEKGLPVAENAIAITFDDGYRSNFTLGYPLLLKYHLPATIFIVGKYTEEGAGYPTLTWDNLRTMQASGLIDIESHTYDLHRKLPRGLNGEEPAALTQTATDGRDETPEEHRDRLEADLVKSRQLIETELGSKSDILSWPYSAYDKADMSAAKQAGFHYFMIGTGYCYPQSSMDKIARVAVPATITMDRFIFFVRPAKINYFQAMGQEIQIIWQHLANIPRSHER